MPPPWPVGRHRRHSPCRVGRSRSPAWPAVLWDRPLDHASAGIALGRLWPHLVEADDDATLGRGGVEALEHPLLRANSGSTRAPNQVSSWRHFSPSASRTSLTRLRFMPMPFSPK